MFAPFLALLLLVFPVAAEAQTSRYDFFKAVRDGDGAVVERAISKPGSSMINARDQDNGETALFIKTAQRDLGWMSYLLSRGADPDLANRDDETPLHRAAQLNFTDGAKLLLGYGAEVDATNRAGETPLIRAVRLRHPDMVELLIVNGADPDHTDNATGRSARDYARDDPRGRGISRAIEAGEKRASAIAAEETGEAETSTAELDFSGDFLTVD